MTTELEKVHSQIIVCTKCELHKTRRKAVPGEGPPDAKIMFVGEGPGQTEDEQGRPFVGATGRLLNQLLESIGLQRSEVFITNIVKCRPPANRAPRKIEIQTCYPYLQKQIDLIKPRIICPLGSQAIMTLLGPTFAVSKIHGKPVRKDGQLILPLYHPAAALYTNSLQEVLFKDFKVLKMLVTDAVPSNQIPVIEDPTVA
ncbi:MAG TPA: uracil-DNA glycosylase [Candidatus Bathyarchaeia archaeon]|nr:uracil-DNA glycosylase [Candidatus Bathyarchaeia archaeon]